MNILGLIPARGGSKRVPGKNIRMLGSIPLIAWTIQAALKSGVLMDIVVSTDDEAIAEVAKRYGASVPELRPTELSTDAASTLDVALYVLDRYQARHGLVDGLLLLQPTSPFRTSDAICRAVRAFESHQGARSVVSVKAANPHPAWCLQVTSDGTVNPLSGWDRLSLRSQDLDTAYALDGAIYLISPRVLKSRKCFVMQESILLPLSGEVESIDIDTEFDWQIAETVLRSGIIYK